MIKGFLLLAVLFLLPLPFSLSILRADNTGEVKSQGQAENIDTEDKKQLESLLASFPEDAGTGASASASEGALNATADGKGKSQGQDKGQTDYSSMVYQWLYGFRAQKESAVVNIFKLKFEKGPLAPFFNSIPGAQKIPYLLTRIVRDEKALPYLVKIANERKKLIYFAVFIVLTIIINFVLKSMPRKHEESIFSSISSAIERAIILMLIRLTAFFILFAKEFTPLWQII